MASQAVVLYNDTRSKPIIPFVGPGRLVHEFNTYVGGKVANGCSKVVVLLGHDPSHLSTRIEKFFGSSSEEIQSKLDFLYDGNIKATHLEKDCLKLLNYAWPQSSSETTQWAVFDIIIVLITRYPGIRRIFCQHRDVPNPFDHVQNSKNWLREDHTAGPEFDFYREFASFCLYKSKVVEIVESRKPSDLARIEPPATSGSSCLNYVPIEELLLYCRDGPEFTFKRLSAIRYLTTILQLPAFWLHNSNRFADILYNICDTMCKLIEDTDSDDPSAERNNVWIRVALTSIDNAVHALLIGIKHVTTKPLTLVTLLPAKLCRPDVATRFPLSSPIASEMRSHLHPGSAQNVNLMAATETQAFEQVSFMTQIDAMGTEGFIDQESDLVSPTALSNESLEVSETLNTRKSEIINECLPMEPAKTMTSSSTGWRTLERTLSLIQAVWEGKFDEEWNRIPEEDEAVDGLKQFAAGGSSWASIQ